MGLKFRRAGKRILACLGAFGAGAIAGLLTGFSPDPPAANSSPLAGSPAEIVALRFQADPGQVASPRVEMAPPRAQFMLASISPDEPKITDFVSYPPTPSAALGATPGEPEATAADVAAALPPAAKRPAQPPRAAPVSTNVLNGAQIASLRDRLRLTPYQEQLWPSVESALREISWRPSREKGAGKNGIRGATIDPDSAPVQRLKSAAVPLIMSMSENQKQEVRTMARLMGLDNLAAQF
jgi:hypothetical protein